MVEKFYDLLYAFVQKRKWLILFVLLFLTAASLIGLRFLQFNSNIESLLPKEEAISRSMNFLKNSSISNKVIISLSLTSPDQEKDALFQAVDELAASLKPPLFTGVTIGMSEMNIAEDMEFFLLNIPQIFSEHELTIIDAKISPEKVSEKMRANYLQLLKPEGIFMHSMIRSDPLGLNLLLLNKLKVLSGSLGYNINIEKGHFISSDGRHAMIIAQTPVSVTDTLGARNLLNNLEEQFKKMPGYISADIICGHTHSLSNEKVMKKDVSLTGIIASIAFVLLFLFVFKDMSAVLIFLIPLFSIFQSIYLCYLFFGQLSYAVVGLATVLAGISVDYSIQVYVAAKNARDPLQAIKRMFRPVAFGGLTTGAVFFSFLFSSIEGYQQLGYLSMVCLVLSIVYCFLVLPHFVSKKKENLLIEERLENNRWSNRYTVVIWGILTIIFLFFAFTVKFDSNIYKIDGTQPEILQAEKRFHQVWGQEKLAILVTTGKSYEKALEDNDSISGEITNAIGADHFASFSMLWPSKKTRQENYARWKQFWEQGREAKLKNLLAEEGAKYGFTRQAFSPFFNNLYKKTDDTADAANSGFIMKLKERFVQKTQSEYQILSFFPDETQYITTVAKIIKQHPDTFLVSEKILSQGIARVIYSDMILMSGITAVMIFVLTFLHFRNIREVILALIPAITSIVWLFGSMSILGIAFNLSTLITSIALMSICVDYGIFMVYRCHYNLRTGIVMAVALAAFTTVIGTGVLIFAEHPALYTVGLTMTVGIVTGYLSTLFVIPHLYTLLMPSTKNKRDI